VQALCQEHQVDIITRGGWHLDDLNHCSGTNVKAASLGKIIIPKHEPGFGMPGGALWHGLYLRQRRHIGRQYDLRITASGAWDWGLPAIHFLSDVVWNGSLKKQFGCLEVQPFANPLRWTYVKVGEWMAGTAGRDLARQDILVANSQWTADISAKFFTHPPVVIYPAVPGDVQSTPWSEQEDSFLCLGRISPEKRIERVIAILDQVRILGHQIRLHLVGSSDDSEYLRQMQKLCEERQDWVVFHGPLYGSDKDALFARCRYGISACDREAFGISTAEMVKAGIVPFVPQAGAQSEIVQEDALIYGDIEDAALKIDALLKSEARQLELHSAMLRRGDEFNSDQFCNSVRALVKGELERLAIAKA
jgi:glycosyltransferase involved in cell wall biosynthesis